MESDRSRDNEAAARMRFLFGIFYPVLFLLFFSTATSSLDPDLGWHLRIGGDIAEKGAVPDGERYAFPVLGYRWIDHEWLTDLALYEAYSSFPRGYVVLSTVFAALATACFALLTAAAARYAGKGASRSAFYFWSVSIQLLAVFSILGYFNIRPQVISWILFTLLILLCDSIFRRKRMTASFLFVALMFAWANLHGSFPLGIAIFGIFTGFVAVSSAYDARQKAALTVSLVLGILATLATPYGLRLWDLVLVEYSTSTQYFRLLHEWAPPYAFPFNVPFLALLLIGGVLVLLNIRWIRRERAALPVLLLAIPLLVLALRHQRHIPFFALLSFPFFIVIAVRFFGSPKRARILAGILIACVGIKVFSLLFAGSPILTAPDPFSTTLPAYPSGAIAFLKTSPDIPADARLLNWYDWGGYIEWVWPDREIFIDGRMPQTPFPGGRSYIGEFARFSSDDETEIGRALDEYAIGAVLWKSGSDRLPMKLPRTYQLIFGRFAGADGRRASDERPAILRYLDARWGKVYEDETAVVYVKP